MVVVFTSARCRGDFFVFEIMDYGSHGQDSLDEMKENPFFILTML